jgi:hypothetical protein
LQRDAQSNTPVNKIFAGPSQLATSQFLSKVNRSFPPGEMVVIGEDNPRL